jgi:hypothetical protein
LAFHFQVYFPQQSKSCFLSPALLPTQDSSDEAIAGPEEAGGGACCSAWHWSGLCHKGQVELLQADAVPTNGYERGRSSRPALDQRWLLVSVLAVVSENRSPQVIQVQVMQRQDQPFIETRSISDRYEKQKGQADVISDFVDDNVAVVTGFFSGQKVRKKNRELPS